MAIVESVSILVSSGAKILRDKKSLVAICFIGLCSVILLQLHNVSVERKQLDVLMTDFVKNYGDVDLSVVKLYDSTNKHRYYTARTYYDLIEGKMKALGLDKNYNSFINNRHRAAVELIVPSKNDPK